ncbi:MAG: acetylxylan esterase [Verrucomicrobia bacterium]|nr:acetylxylan esterase [Verrucomicrobiota bacterium]MCH8514213.1 acetylxylan esterase [Kiritimatiellia bacterium]
MLKVITGAGIELVFLQSFDLILFMQEFIHHDFSFDPRYGYDEAALRDIQAPDTTARDFEAFWRNLHAQAMGDVPLNLFVEEMDCPWPGLILEQCTYSVWPNYRVGAWLLRPDNDKLPELGVVVGHGYGGREAPEPGRGGLDRATLFPVAPGFHISPDPRLPHNDSQKHVIHGIESHKRYILGTCAAAFWRAADVLEELFAGPLPHLHYVGWSFGGGLGALMLPWEPRYQSAELGQVTFANHPFRLRHDCVGSGSAVRERWLAHPNIEETLCYYDAANSLRHLRIPTAFACALFDPSVPPPGQWSAANAHPGPKVISSYPVGHFDYNHPDQVRAEREHQRRVTEFFGFPGLLA